jgi:hypothetical protein
MSQLIATQIKQSCPVCDSPTELAFTAKVLHKYQADYNVCSNCGYLFAVDPHWLSEAYTSAIASSDTGLVKRNISISAKLACILYFFLRERGDGCYVDIAGGYGMLTRLMRDYGFDFFWQDKYCENLLAEGFEYTKDSSKATAVTAFEVLEHIERPVEFIKIAMSEFDVDTLIFSTVLYQGSPPNPSNWWYYAFASGQHIGFFQKRTLQFIGQRLNRNLSSANNIHVFSRTKVSETLLKIISAPIFSRLFVNIIQLCLGSKTTRDQTFMSHRL